MQRGAGRTSGLVEMGQVGEVVAGLEHGGVHQGRQVGIVARLDGIQRRLDRLGLHRTWSASSLSFSLCSLCLPLSIRGAWPVAVVVVVVVVVAQRTSPFSSLKTSFTLSPAICLSVTSEATQPSVVSGCHARVPMS